MSSATEKRGSVEGSAMGSVDCPGVAKAGSGVFEVSDIPNEKLPELLELIAGFRSTPAEKEVLIAAARRIQILESQLLESVKKSVDILQVAAKLEDLYQQQQRAFSGVAATFPASLNSVSKDRDGVRAKEYKG